MNVFEFVFVGLQGARMPLSNYRNQPILFVNTASECGHTSQYKELQRLWMDYRQSGLIVIGMPCDDFGHQEPGDEDSIAEFCETNYQVSFPMTGKYHVMGVSAHPMFRAIREEFGDDATPRWNFHKYLFDRNGQLVDFWPSAVMPGDTAVTHKIECNLQSWVL
ncbi:MAG: glutathione peroxidase [Xanthomonadales bacterium]|nr:glutathione peroxidase [Xanthomonadales bacterium]